MEVTGGEIQIDKSWWHLIDYVWHRREWVCNDADVDFDFVAAGENELMIFIQRFRCHEAADMLGIWLAHNGNPSKCISVLK